MRANRQTVAVATGALAAMAWCAAPAIAAPYVTDPTMTTNTSNPPVGGALTVAVLGFTPDEDVDLSLYSTPTHLATIHTDADGTASTVVNLPSAYTCEHELVALGATGDTARTTLLIGPADACSPDGNTGNGNNGNSGSGNNGNSGSGNTGNGNTGTNNTGNGNSGSGNTGNGNTGTGHTGNGNTNHGNNSGYGSEGYDFLGYTGPPLELQATSNSRSLTPTTTPAIAAWSVVGLAALASVTFVRRRRA